MMIGRADYFAPGDWNTVCFQCGRKRKASTMKKHWQGYYVCPEHWEPRQPQDFTRSVPDVQTPPWVQPMPADTFVEYCSMWGLQGKADYGTADCAMADYDNGYSPDTCVSATSIAYNAVSGCMIAGA